MNTPTPSHGMQPIDIKYALERLGYTQTDIARAHKVPRSTVYAVIHSTGRSKTIETAIAQLLGMTVSEIWPHWHGPDAKRRRRRMNTADLYARVQELEAQLVAAKAA